MNAPLIPPPMLLLVDDDPAVRASLQFSLELEGFAVETFDSGETLVARNSPARHDCLVLDYRLLGKTILDAVDRHSDRFAKR